MTTPLTRREFALSLAALLPAAGRGMQAIRFAVPDGASADVRLGLRFGVDDAGRAAALLGRSIEQEAASRIRITETADLDIDGTAFSTSASPEAAEQLLHRARREGAANDTARVVAWHPSLRRFGASELNERFRRAHLQPMTAAHWRAWFAVKAVVDTALRNEGGVTAAALTQLRFDGHKGVPLMFDPRSRALRQPLYVEQNGRIVWPPQP